MIAIVEHFFAAMLRNQSSHRYKSNCLPIDKVGLFILTRRDQVSVDWLADQACLSPRQFQRQFVERNGMGPKMYARLARFDAAVKLKNSALAKDWLSIALAAGYHDYQHLVRDFKDFTTLTPNEFMLADSQSPERSFGKIETE
jgi:transcriptional regulator GlxA family with amidase domain